MWRACVLHWWYMHIISGVVVVVVCVSEHSSDANADPANIIIIIIIHSRTQIFVMEYIRLLWFHLPPLLWHYSKIGRRRTPRRRTPRLENRQNLRTVQARIIRFKNTFKIFIHVLTRSCEFTRRSTLYMEPEVSTCHVHVQSFPFTTPTSLEVHVLHSHVCTCTCMYMYMYMYIHVHVHVHVHTCTCTWQTSLRHSTRRARVNKNGLARIKNLRTFLGCARAPAFFGARSYCIGQATLG